MKTIEELITNINNNIEKVKNLSFLKNILDNYEGIDWKEKVNFKLGIYNKILLHQCKKLDYEIILICWDKNSESPIHRHPKNGCLLKVLKGKLNEVRYKGKNINNMILTSNSETSYMHDNFGSHKIIPIGDSISLHIYSPCNYYSNLN